MILCSVDVILCVESFSVIHWSPVYWSSLCVLSRLCPQFVGLCVYAMVVATLHLAMHVEAWHYQHQQQRLEMDLALDLSVDELVLGVAGWSYGEGGLSPCQLAEFITFLCLLACVFCYIRAHSSGCIPVHQLFYRACFNKPCLKVAFLRWVIFDE